MGKSSILLLNGNMQKKLHGLIGSFLKSPQLKEQITVDIEKYVLDSMRSWEDGQVVYIQDETKKIAFQVLLKALMSLNPGDELEYLKQEFRKFISGLVSIPVKLPGTRLYKSLQAKANMVKMVHRIIEDRKENYNNNGSRQEDVLDVLLHETNNITGHFTRDLISDNMIDLMIPGEDSVPMLMTLAVHYLTSCPLALQQLQEENMKLKESKEGKKEPVTWSDYMSLPFTQNVITETLRLGNIITGVLRKSLQDIEIKGHLIPKGWCVFTYFRSIHLDEDNYESPYKFNPWRWQEKDPTGSSFTPFGGGHRLCPGLEIARLEASIFLHLLVTRYSWEAEEDSVVSFPTVHMKKNMPIKVKKFTSFS
ncbi:3-epi-6-deoxocathasterone 23-monooxygenase CYP90D1 isoform X2 [Cryptomeria japonica]|nr:3-epi-6-deoxocathasterone 23-monooxygenase CYP90D1 isoform X2 [Cryptomeria japonica]